MARNQLLGATPYPVETALKRLGQNLRAARLNRNLSIAEVAEKIGTGPRAVMDAEKGKVSTGVGVHAALLWVYDLLPSLEELANPATDEQGQVLAATKRRARARKKGALDNDF
jgi:transcriptional regulator with XRE-family HTH domain